MFPFQEFKFLAGSFCRVVLNFYLFIYFLSGSRSVLPQDCCVHLFKQAAFGLARRFWWWRRVYVFVLCFVGSCPAFTIFFLFLYLGVLYCFVPNFLNLILPHLCFYIFTCSNYFKM